MRAIELGFMTWPALLCLVPALGAAELAISLLASCVPPASINDQPGGAGSENQSKTNFSLRFWGERPLRNQSAADEKKRLFAYYRGIGPRRLGGTRRSPWETGRNSLRRKPIGA